MPRATTQPQPDDTITKLQELIEHHKYSAEQLRRYLDAARANIVVLDRDLNITEVNRPLLESFDLGDRQAVIGEKCYRLMKGLEAPCECCTALEAYRTGEVTCRRTTREEKKFLGDRILEICSIPIRDASGRVTNVLEFASDITAQILLEEEIRLRRRSEGLLDSQLRLEKLVAAISTSLINSPADRIDRGIDQALATLGSFFDVDRSYLFLLRNNGRTMDNTHEWCAPGIEPQRANLQDLCLDDSPWWRDRLHQDEYIHIPRVIDLPPEAAAEKEVLLAQQIQSLITVPVRYGGILLGFLGFDSVRGQRTWSGEQIALLQLAGEIIANALKRRRSEQERRELEERLHQAQKLEAIGTLAGGIAHTFNNLLMLIQGNASLILLDPFLGPEHRQRLQGISDAVKRGSELTARLLGFARGGKYTVQPTDVNTLVDNSLRLFAHSGSGIRIHRDFQADLCPVAVDRDQIQQVLLNLYVNARQAMEAGGDLYLETRTAHLPPEQAGLLGIRTGTYARISVTDTGTGMDSDVVARIFEPFFSTRKTGEGSGLGLASAYGIVRNHGGTIDVRSRPGKGSCFVIYLPASPAEPEEENPVATAPREDGGTILLVDDEAMILDFGETLLTRAGYTVLRAGSGDEALTMFRQHGDRIDLVILDLIMPDLHGREVFDSIRAMNPKARILLSSGYSVESHAAEILEQGGDGFLQKPFTSAELLRTIRQVINRAP